MKYEELLQLIGGAGVFDSSLLLAGRGSATGVRRQLDRWVKTGRVVMLRRGVYLVPPPYTMHQPHSFRLANALRRASYVSLQSALAYYGMIPEHVPVTTSVTTNRAEEVGTTVGRFTFRHVKKDMFFGYSEVEVSPGSRCLLATPEKALVDLLYLTPGSDAPGWLEELRLEPVPSLDRARLVDIGARCGSVKVKRALRRLMARWNQQDEGESL